MNGYLALFDRLGQLGRQRYRMAEDYFARLGLNHTEARLLTLLTQAGGRATQDALAGQLYIDRSNVGRALKALEARDYVARQKDAKDKRANFVQITAKGSAAAGEIASLKGEMAAAFFNGLEESEAAMIAGLLGRVEPFGANTA
ncbi:MarR family winged helix-turn-helix transcriptional regulator [Gimibacter soli]|uniref:MarR family transcriptional regulator n=1 Tax=Gimibacter soli TaxID=3024400 RepID=A0AAF0BLY2_9PROT|nr:MarR family transcriptional regulator [Gimibacter soli]WCL54737.1 MarR family transcriptional regulator [Gimibacter soli]